MTTPGYEQFQGMRNELIEIIQLVGSVAAGLGQETMARTVGELAERVASDTFTVLNLGEFNAGKSTTINGMLGDKVLPAGGKPMTAVLSVLRWGDQPKATLFRADKDGPGGIDPEPFGIDIGELQGHITVGAEEAGNRWGLAEIEWPLELLRQGVAIVDSPGLNDTVERQRITLEYVNRADAVIFVFSALAAFNLTERTMLDEHLRAFNQENMFFLVNRINQVEEDEVDDMKADFGTRARAHCGIGDDRIFFINASGALRGRMQERPELVAESGLPAFEKALEYFLIHSRGRLKIVPPAVQIQSITAEARATIDDLRTLLANDLKALTEEYERQRGPLESLRKERALIDQIVATRLAATRSAIEDSAFRTLVEAADRCGNWATEVERTQSVNINLFKARENAKGVIEEVSRGLSARIEDHIGEWRDGELADLIGDSSTKLEQEVGQRFTAFAEGLDEVRAALLSAGRPAEADFLPTAGSRAGGVAVGALLNPGALLVGAQFGFKEMMREMIPQIGLAVGLALLSFGPQAILTALFAMGAIRSMLKLRKLNDRIVTTVAEGVTDKLRTEARELSKIISGRIIDQFEKRRREIDQDLAGSISAVVEQVEFALAQRDQSKAATEETERSLAGYRQTLGDAERRAAAVIEGWALS